MKNWLFKQLNVVPRNEYEAIVEGYLDSQERIRNLKEDIKKLGERDVLTELVKDLYNTVSEKDILQNDSGQWIYQGKKISEGVRQAIISDAHTILNSVLWNILLDEIRCESNRRMFLKSKTEHDLIAGKVMLYTLDLLNTKLGIIAKEKLPNKQ